MTDSERVARIVERASIRKASGGIDWFEQIQAAGFPLYVKIENPQPAWKSTFGDQQFSPTTQFGLMPKRIDPLTVPGVLITSSANTPGAGVVIASQFGIGHARFGTSFFREHVDPNYVFPQPANQAITDRHAKMVKGVFPFTIPG